MIEGVYWQAEDIYGAITSEGFKCDQDAKDFIYFTAESKWLLEHHPKFYLNNYKPWDGVIEEFHENYVETEYSNPIMAGTDFCLLDIPYHQLIGVHHYETEKI